ncbi:LolA family protein [Paenibacillus endoradicis]|uniref:LolA family protein n=1 Tax=Paenibacillus endoradicis TaxID=2972487 RepID=UPI0021592A8B|nr:outer membrane lipoprotein carrier protein LolA [Paenibacillus endoradicis]MCR8657070.1 outer membrane lipoprotein carrier protein LolA [Paenibacillus endoradicis]
MRRMTWIAAIILSMALVLSACGTKDAESVVKDLDKFLNSMEGYSGTGTMTLHNGQQPQVYQVEVSYSKPEAYRIKLTNAEKDISQIVLRNDEGVFVLTPKQNKVFRFQSDWPQKQGQVYLYQTLIQSILLDGSRQFTTTDDAYVFDVMAKYNSTSLARQKIWLSQDDYKPMQVEVSDTNATVLVDVKFDTFEFNPTFAESFFETESNMQTSAGDVTEQQPTTIDPSKEDVDTLAPGDEGVGAEAGNVDSDTSTDPNAGAPVEQSTSGEEGSSNDDDATSNAPTTTQSFTAMAPTHLPLGVNEKDMTDIEFAGSQGVMTRYEGTYNYTLIQTEAKDIATTLVPGDFVNLGFTIAELTSGDDVQTLTWTYFGNQFRLSSADLPEVEMIKVAQSVLAEVSK